MNNKVFKVLRTNKPEDELKHVKLNSFVSLKHLLKEFSFNDSSLYVQQEIQEPIDASLEQQSPGIERKVMKTMHLEVVVKEVQYGFKPSYLIIFNNIDSLIKHQNQEMQSHFQEAITATISHEQLNPLNSIINFSRYLYHKTLDFLG
mmetsp:Transcript_41286/g.62860  ORF Transcript_41286/g.62860 Transcript_41286/m.62860 type:complete len:147 (-) Transcript_41286:551-991(-)